jgi:hypothetical protein
MLRAVQREFSNRERLQVYLERSEISPGVDFFVCFVSLVGGPIRSACEFQALSHSDPRCMLVLMLNAAGCCVRLGVRVANPDACVHRRRVIHCAESILTLYGNKRRVEIYGCDNNNNNNTAKAHTYTLGGMLTHPHGKE